MEVLYIIRRKKVLIRNPRWVKSTPVICARLEHSDTSGEGKFWIYLTDARFEYLKKISLLESVL